MSAKKSVFLSDSSVSWIEETTNAGEGPKWSESINATFEQFRFLLRENLPTLSADEWRIILDTFRAHYAPAYGVPTRIASEIMDELGEVDLSRLDLRKPEYAVLIRKLHRMSQIEQMAILYVVQIFWLNDWSSCENLDDILKDIIAKF